MVWWVGNPFDFRCFFGHWGALTDVSDDEDLPRGERLEFSASEAARFERARFEQSMSTIGMGMPRLPWEQGVVAEIFNPGNDLVSHAMHFCPLCLEDLQVDSMKRSKLHRQSILI